jgi:hypothetical protein
MVSRRCYHIGIHMVLGQQGFCSIYLGCAMVANATGPIVD